MWRPPAPSVRSLQPGAVSGATRAILSAGVPRIADAATPKDDAIGLLKLAAEVEHALYRVVQEALINVHKHASATHAEVRYFGESGRLVLEIEDDGVGIGNESEPAMGAGVGIPGMRARIAQLGGTLTLSSPRPGVLVTAEVPVVETDWMLVAKDQFLLPIIPWK